MEKGKTVLGIMLSLLLIGFLTSAVNIHPVKASGTIYIRANGSIDPSTANITSADNITYTFTDNNYDRIVIERDNIVVDGTGKTLQGTGSWGGISLSGRNNVTIRNMEIKAFYTGIALGSSLNNTISANNITNNEDGISLTSSSNFNIISGNNITTNNYCGIHLRSSLNNTISGNNITNNDEGVLLDSVSNNTISGNNIKANRFYNGIRLYSSLNNTISGNTITNSEFDANGIGLEHSSNFNLISGNNITNNDADGVWLHSSSNNIISENNITNNGFDGIYLLQSSNFNLISGNSITANNYYGISLSSSSSNNIISENNITNNYRGIRPYSSSGNSIYHNNIIGNSRQVDSYNSTNLWDDGYPSGGNYWSNYTGLDFYSGPYQNETGSDGIGDTPHIITTSNQDSYPLMKPWPTKVVETTVTIEGEDYPIIIESNVTTTHAVATRTTLYFTASGSSGTTGYINATFPIGLNKTEIQVFVNGEEPTPPPIITSNGTHYSIYFEFTLSVHNIAIQYAIADIATTNVTPHKTIVGQGYSMRINATIQNQGDYEETFNVAVYADLNTAIIGDEITVGTQNVTLSSGDSTTLTFTWNTTGVAKGNYTITAIADTVPGETDTTDNTLTDGWITVAMIGDISSPTKPGVPDGKVDMADVGAVARLFGVVYPDPRYNANYDITGPTTGLADGKIDMMDIGTVARRFGQVDP